MKNTLICYGLAFILLGFMGVVTLRKTEMKYITASDDEPKELDNLESYEVAGYEVLYKETEDDITEVLLDMTIEVDCDRLGDFMNELSWLIDDFRAERQSE